MEDVTLTLSQFLQLASSGFGCGFVVGFVRWAVRYASSSVQYAVTCRA